MKQVFHGDCVMFKTTGKAMVEPWREQVLTVFCNYSHCLKGERKVPHRFMWFLLPAYFRHKFLFKFDTCTIVTRHQIHVTEKTSHNTYLWPVWLTGPVKELSYTKIFTPLVVMEAGENKRVSLAFLDPPMCLCGQGARCQIGFRNITWTPSAKQSNHIWHSYQ